MELTRDRLDELYEEWNRPEFISPDPLETLSPYNGVADREVAALLAASLAYGRVAALLKPLKRTLAVMGSSPADYVRSRGESAMESDFEGIVHRFARPGHLAALLAGAGSAARRYGSLEAAFLSGYESEGGGEDVVAGLVSLTGAVRRGAHGAPGHLLADPRRGSACKRLHLFLRWMVRKDAVDPGGWAGVKPSKLLLPLDTWTHRIALRAGWTDRNAPDLKTLRAIGDALSRIHPEDPVRYDFALSRFGIRSGLNLDMLFGE